MARVSLLLRGVWWRRSLALAVLAVATVTTGVATLGPLYARAAGESTLRDSLTQAPPEGTGLHFEAIANGSSPATIRDTVRQAPRPGSIAAYPRTITSAYSAALATVDGGVPARTALLWRDGECSHVIILSGHCPTAAGQVLAAARAVADRDYRWKLGGRVKLTNVPGAITIDTVTIVGTYRPRDTNDPFWFGEIYFGVSQATERQAAAVEALLAPRPAFDRVPAGIQVKVDVDYPMRISRVRVDDVSRLRTQVTAVQRAHPSTSISGLPLHTGLPGVLDDADHQAHLADVGILVTTLQLGLLAWVVLFHVISDAAAARGNEIALAKLRGFRPSRTVRFGLGEPLLLTLIAAPLGLLLAWLVTHLISAHVLAPATPVVLNWPTIGALVGGFAGGVVAAALAAYRTLTRPVLEQWRRTTTRQRSGVLSLAVDVALAGLAIAGLVLLHGERQGDGSVALLAPGLLVTAVALLGTRLLPVVLRPLLPTTRATGRVGTFLAARQVVRRPAGLRLAALLAVAIGLATFSVGAEAVAGNNRSARAQAELGAARVASVQFSSSTDDPMTEVAKADPDGRWAMAAARWIPNGGGSVTGTVLAVDASRFARVAYSAHGAPDNAALAKVIGSANVPLVTVTGTAIRARITTEALSGHTQLQFDLRTSRQPNLSVLAPNELRVGTHDYEARIPCTQGCTFQGLTWNRADTYIGAMNGTVRIEALAARRTDGWAGLDTRLTRPGAWRTGAQYGHSTATVQAGAAGLQCHYRSDSGGYGGISYAYTTSPIAAVASPGGVASGPSLYDPPRVEDTLGFVASYRVLRTARVLPAVLTAGVLVDLTSIRTQVPGFDTEASWQVWLGPHAPADALGRLRAAGLIVQNVQSEHARVVLLGRQGPALALYLLLTCAIAAGALAVGATAISISASARRRSFEMASLRAVGVPRRGLYRAGVLEQLLLLGAAVVLGVPSGVVGAWLAIPIVPEFADKSPTPLAYAPPLVPVLLVAAGFCVLIVFAALVAARSIIRSARPARLREAEE